MAARQHVCILMATRNGARHLPAQLQSFLDQSHDDWSLWVSDDGSTDATRAIIEMFRTGNPDREVHLVDGPRQGAARNFLALLDAADPPPGALIAFSDQDDVWQPDKLARAARALAGADSPTAYAAAAIRAGPDLVPREISRPAPRGPSFGNALVQNVMGGHSLVMTPAARTLLLRSGPVRVPFHDWWVYLLLTGAGGRAICDPEPSLFYRQHNDNALGTNTGAEARLRRLTLVMRREYGSWIEANCAALSRCADLLTPENRALLADFHAALQAWPLLRPLRLHKLGIRRQTSTGTWALGIAALLGRI